MKRKNLISSAIIVVCFWLCSFASTLFGAGSFNFNDGTTQGWTLDQMYVTSNQTKFTPVLGYTLLNSNNELSAYTSYLGIGRTDQNDIYLESPDLSSNSNWQGISGYSIDVKRLLYSPCWGDFANIFFVQLQLKVIDTADGNKEKLFAEHDGTNFVFHDITNYGQLYQFTWTPSWLTDPKYKVKKIRIRITGPGDVLAECGYRGSWNIDNVNATGGTPSYNTNPGSNVQINLGSGVNVTFDNVTGAGNTSLTTSSSGTPPPSGFTVVPSSSPIYYSITTTATFAGNIKICIQYNDAGLTAQQEAALKLKVYQTPPGQWNDITTSLNTSTNIICGTVNHLSEFAIMYSSGGPGLEEWVLTNNPIYGTINCFAVAGSKIFAGTEWGGALLSTNGGNSWSEVNTGLTNLTVRALCSDGTNLFAGTWGGGVFRSGNYGVSWTAVNTGLTDLGVSSLFISGTNLLAGTWGGGVFRSTNNGSNWTAINNGITEKHIRALLISGANFFAGTINGLFLSINSGTSWTTINNGLTNTAAISLANVPLDGLEILFTGTDGGGVFLSGNNGANWDDLNTGLTNLYIPYLCPSTTNLFAATWGGGVFLTLGQTATWNAVSDGLTDLYIRSLIVGGTNLFAGTNDGGIWRRPLSAMIPDINIVPDIDANPSSWNYGQVNVGSYVDKTIVISNIGTFDLNVTGMQLIGSNASEFSVQSGGGTFTLASTATRNIVVRFAPTSTGNKNAELSISSNDPDENPFFIALAGDGVAGPLLVVNPLTLNFGETNLSEWFSITNAGSGSLIWSVAENPEKPWITSITPNSGTGNASVTVTANRAFLPGNSDTGTIAVTSNGGNTNVTVLISKQAEDAVEFSARDTSASPGTTIDIPISTTDLTGKEILALSLTVETNTSVLTPIGIATTGAILSAWGNVFSNISAGQISVTGAATIPLSGSGTLVFLRYQVNPAATGGQTSPIHFVDVILNEGNPPTATLDGIFTCTIGFDVSGTVLYYQNSKPVNNATMTLDGHTTTTGTNGTFSFATIPGGNLALTPEKDGELGTGISAFDASLILRNVVGMITLTPYQLIAADVSGNGSVTAFDASYILRYVVNLISSFPVGDDWKFVPSNFAINTTNWSTAPNSISYTPLNSNQTNQDFKGIIYGDVSGNWAFSGLAKNVTGSATVEFGEITLPSSAEFLVPIIANVAGEMLSLEMIIQYNAEELSLAEIRLSDKLAGFSEFHNLNNGILVIALAGAQPVQSSTELISLKFEKENVESNRPTVFNILHANMNEGQIAVDFSSDGLILDQTLPMTHQLEQNYPNPFNATTTIAYYLVKPAEVCLTIFDVNGKEVNQLIHETSTAGYHTVTWEARDVMGMPLSSGIYFYRLEIMESGSNQKPFMQVKKLILMK